MAEAGNTTRTLSSDSHATPNRKQPSPFYRKEPSRIEEDSSSSENTIRDENSVYSIKKGQYPGDVSINPRKQSTKSNLNKVNKKELPYG